MNEPNSAPTIRVTAAADPDTFDVEVRGRTTTLHRVTVSPAYLRELDVGSFQASHVVHEAFEFLLEHEPNSSILRTFDLRKIERYFPSFRQEIAQRLRG